jgi:hypothetical protein
MVHHGTNRDDWDMTRSADEKLARLAASHLGTGRSPDEVRLLGRLADLAVVPAGTVLQREGSWAPWSYYLLGGATLLSSDDRPLAVAGEGSWLLGAGTGPTRGSLPVTVVAASDTPALCFRANDLDQARHVLPDLIPAASRS